MCQLPTSVGGGYRRPINPDVPAPVPVGGNSGYPLATTKASPFRTENSAPAVWAAQHSIIKDSRPEPPQLSPGFAEPTFSHSTRRPSPHPELWGKRGSSRPLNAPISASSMCVAEHRKKVPCPIHMCHRYAPHRKAPPEPLDIVRDTKPSCLDDTPQHQTVRG